MLATTSLTSRAGTLYVRRKACAFRSFSAGSNMSDSDYSTWNVEQLVSKVQALEKDLKEANQRCHALATHRSLPLHAAAKPSDKVKPIDPSRYSTRMIALKFAYLGQNYNGLEYAAGNTTVQPTVEEALWAALIRGRLVFPTDERAIAPGHISWEGCDYSKCGRTDKGVSAFGQVVGLRVRSNRPVPGRRKKAVSSDNGMVGETKEHAQQHTIAAEEVEKPFHPVKDEIPYVHALNRLLPPDIRALAWCSDLPEDFSARFSCRERRYRYFFTNPAFPPTFGANGFASSGTKDHKTKSPRREGWLDIKAMQDAAKRYEGLHDFRNLCKIDPSKQLTDFRRRIYLSEIMEVDSSSDSAAYVTRKAFSELALSSDTNGTNKSATTHIGPKVYQFVLHGSAFLWHQVRHMVAILFLVGQGHEKPDIVEKLMDVDNCPRKPHYEMADDAPLVLWDCVFPDLDSESREDALNWIYAGDEAGAEGSKASGKGKHGPYGVIDSLWEIWRKRKIDEILAGSLLNLAASQGKNVDISAPLKEKRTKVFLGGDSAPSRGSYIPIMQRGRGEHFETANAKYALKKGITPRSEEEVQEFRNSRRDRRHDHLEQHGE